MLIRYQYCQFFQQVLYCLRQHEHTREKKHLTFADEIYGPEFHPLAEAIVKEGVAPRIICESDGTMAEDALEMKKMWQNAQGGNI